MKKFTLLLVIATLLLFACGKTEKQIENLEETAAETQKAVSMAFMVDGIGEISKIHIEKAAYTVKGVTEANWDMDSKNIKIVGTSDVVWEDVHTAISEAGFDTSEMKASDEAYNALPEEAHYRIKKVKRTATVRDEGEQKGTVKAKRTKPGE